MPRFFKQKSVNRIIDANINRAKEGLRVCEEITRFLLENRQLTAQLKNIRHKIDALTGAFPCPKDLVKERDSLLDVGKDISAGELKRRNYQDIFFANMQRVKESIRVLEEFAKLNNVRAALAFKKLRYTVYEIEKELIKKLASLRYHR